MHTPLDPNRPTYAILRCSTPPPVDGWLDAPCWQGAPWVDRFIAMDTWAAAKPASVALLWDGSTLYVGLKLTEPQVGMLHADGAPVQDDDLVELYLDPGVAGVEYLVVSINPRGDVIAERMVIDNPGWGTRHPLALEGVRSAARLTGMGWQVEVAIPFTALGVPAPAPDDRWQGNVCRMDRLAFSWSFWALEEPVTYSYDDYKLFPALHFADRHVVQHTTVRAGAPSWPDQPRFALRGFMYDTSRGSLIYTPDYWRAQFPFFKALGFNTLLLYFENHLRYRSHGAFAPEGSWSVEELVAVQEAAAAHGIDVIPAQTSLGHCTGILSHPAYQEFAEAGSDGYQFCVAHPGSRRVLTELFAELAAASRSPYISINADESAYLGLCPRCRAAFPGWSKGRIFLHHILPIYEVIRAHGKRMLMWDDMPWLYAEIIEELPRDIILLDWHYSLHRRYPSLDRWRALGFDTIVCPGMYKVENAFWFGDQGAEQGAMGIINTLWEDHTFPLGSRWHHFAATSWAAHADAPTDLDAWYAQAGEVFFGLGGDRIGRSLAALDNVGRHGYRLGVSAPTELEWQATSQMCASTAELLAAGACTGSRRDWLEEFFYARQVLRLQSQAARLTAQGGLDLATRLALEAESADLRREGLARWERHCRVPSQQQAFLERFTAIETALAQIPR
jgi:hypothetical protein